MRLRKVDPTPDQLSDREYQAMLYIEEDYTAHHDVPTVRDLMAALDMSLGGAKGLLDRLVDYGYLRRGCKNCRRNFRIVKSVRAGQPVPAEDMPWATLYLETLEAQRAELPTADAPPVSGPIFHLHTLDATEQKALDFIQAYTETHDQPPTVRDIQAALGFRSSSGTYQLLLRLEADDWLDCIDGAAPQLWRIHTEPE